MKCKRIIALLGALALLLGLLSGCGGGDSGGSSAAAPSAEEPVQASGPDTAEEPQDNAPAEAGPASEGEYAVTLEGDKITCGDGVVSGSTVTLTKAGTYRVTGSLSDGQIIVEAGKEDDVVLILDGVNIACSTGAPIAVMQSGNATIELAEGTENTVTDGANYVFPDPAVDEPDAAIFSKDDLIISGGGKLTVNGNYDMAIHSKDDLDILEGTLVVTSVGDGLKGKDSVTIQGGDVTITAGGDGIQASNDTEKGDVTISGGTLKIECTEDAVKAEHSLYVSGGTIDITAGNDGLKAKNTIGDGGLYVSGGDITIDCQDDATQSEGVLDVADGIIHIVTRDGSMNAPAHQEGFGPPGWFNDTVSDEETSAKGLKALGDITISGGEITIDAYDDAIHSDASVTISDGAVMTLSTGDDGIHATDTLSIQGGDITIRKSYEGLEGLYIDISGGSIDLTADDDGMNANGEEMWGFGGPGGPPGFGGGSAEGSDTLEDANTYLHISGGEIRVNAYGDGLDSNGFLLVEGGEIYVSGPSTSMNGSLDSGSTARINGGTIIAAGASGMDETFDAESSQASIRCTLATWLTADLTITLTDEAGTVLMEHTFDFPDKYLTSVVISCPALQEEGTYYLTCGQENLTIEMTGVNTSVRQSASGSPETTASGGFGGGPGGGPGGFGGPPPGGPGRRP